jgi:hypothetical protein
VLDEHAVEHVVKHAQLAVAAHQRERCRVRHIHPVPGPRLVRLPCGDRLLLALCSDRLVLVVVDHRVRRTVGALTDEHAVDRSRGLQPCGRVDHVAGRHSFARDGTRAE